MFFFDRTAYRRIAVGGFFGGCGIQPCGAECLGFERHAEGLSRSAVCSGSTLGQCSAAANLYGGNVTSGPRGVLLTAGGGGGGG